jgi:uncharacterized protein (DUF1015 family)
MADVRPFRGLRYNPARVSDLGAALCPPFDVISGEEQARLYSASERNAVRLELTRTEDAVAGEDRYAAAARWLTQWRKNEVVTRDERPGFYLVAHEFEQDGERLTRTELFGAVRLEPLDSGSIRPHEVTRAGHKEERLRLMQATEANISPIMLLYGDDGGVAQTLAEAAAAVEPIEADPGSAERFRVWPIDEPSMVRRLQEALAGQPLYIADGHHRFETAINYRDLRSAEAATWGEEQAANYVMAALISSSDPGLLCLPYHRLLKGLDDEALAAVRRRLDDDFMEVRYNSTRAPAIQVAEEALASLRSPDVVFEVWGLEPRMRSSFRLRGSRPLDSLTSAGHSAAWASLGPAVFRELVLKPALGMEEEEAERKGLFSFSTDATDAVHRVNTGECQLAFLPRPVPMTAFKEVSDRGERLPPKSTYFHPKLATGIVFNPLQGKR